MRSKVYIILFINYDTILMSHSSVWKSNSTGTNIPTLFIIHNMIMINYYSPSLHLIVYISSSKVSNQKSIIIRLGTYLKILRKTLIFISFHVIIYARVFFTYVLYMCYTCFNIMRVYPQRKKYKFSVGFDRKKFGYPNNGQ